MTARAAFVLGFFVLLAALVRGGVYSAGHDFVVNRFTGHFEFVPADEDTDDDTPIVARALTARRPDARLACSVRGAARRAIRLGR